MVKLDKGGNRIGTVSSFDKKTGMASVLYSDRDGDVTQMLPFATFNGEYKVPETGSKVLVVHLSNGSEIGIILGTYWNEATLQKDTAHTINIWGMVLPLIMTLVQEC